MTLVRYGVSHSCIYTHAHIHIFFNIPTMFLPTNVSQQDGTGKVKHVIRENKRFDCLRVFVCIYINVCVCLLDDTIS